MKERRKTPRKNRSVDVNKTDKKLEQAKKPITSGTSISVPPGEDKTSSLLSIEYAKAKKMRPS